MELEEEVERLKSQLQQNEDARARLEAEQLQRTTTIDSVIQALKSLNGDSQTSRSIAQELAPLDGRVRPTPAAQSSVSLEAGETVDQQPVDLGLALLDNLPNPDFWTNSEGWVTLPMDKHVLADASDCTHLPYRFQVDC